MRIVMSGYFGFDNTGDEAILQAIVDSLRKLQPDVSIVVLSNNPESTAAKYHVEAVNRWDIKAIAKTIRNADGLISGGGSLLQDKTGWKTIPYYTAVMRIAKFYRKPVFVYAQGMGPIDGALGKWLTRSTLNKSDQITVRDADSKKLLEEIGLKKPIDIVPDAVFGLAVKQQASIWLTDQSLSADFITISVRDWPVETDFIRKLAAVCDRFAKKGTEILFVPMHGEDDRQTAEKVMGYMETEARHVPVELELEEKISIIAASCMLIGMRLHSLIFASLSHTPFVAISYDPKIDSFAQLVNQPIGANVNESNWSENELYEIVNDVYENVDDYHSLLKNHVEPLKRDALQTAQLALDTFQ